MDLMTRERQLPHLTTQVHVHDQQVCAIDYARGYLCFRRSHGP